MSFAKSSTQLDRIKNYIIKHPWCREFDVVRRAKRLKINPQYVSTALKILRDRNEIRGIGHCEQMYLRSVGKPWGNRRTGTPAYIATCGISPSLPVKPSEYLQT